MKRVVFTDSWKGFFASFSLNSFDDFFRYTAGRIINKNNKRDVSILKLGQSPQDNKVFFLKRFTNPHFKDIIAAWYNFGKSTSQAELEWENIHLLGKNEILTYNPVCFGEQIKFGVEQKSFIVTEKINAVEFIDYLPQKWHKLDRVKQEKIITAIAKLIRKAHDADIILPDFAVWHIFVHQDSLDDAPQLSVIDLHRMRHNVKNQNRKTRDLGKFLWSMSEKYFDAGHKDLLISEYAGNDSKKNRTLLESKIRRRAEILLKRHKPKNY